MESPWNMLLCLEAPQEFDVSECLHLAPLNKIKWTGLLVFSNILIFICALLMHGCFSLL